MILEEFIKLGCVKCGMHEFWSTGAIQHDGPTEVTCSLCGEEYERDYWSNLDSLEWERQYNAEHGLSFTEPRTVQYHDEEQFVKKFVESVEGEHGEVPSTTD